MVSPAHLGNCSCVTLPPYIYGPIPVGRSVHDISTSLYVNANGRKSFCLLYAIGVEISALIRVHVRTIVLDRF